MLCDYHVHSDYSDDSWYPMEEVVRDAMQMGIAELCFTDHVDYGVKVDWDQDAATARLVDGKPVLNVNYPKYFRELEALKIKYGHKIVIKRGLEFGMQMHTLPSFQKLFDTYPMDFVLLSVHQVDDQEFWTGEFQRGRTETECYDRYYQEMYQLVTHYHDYSCLAHMDLIRRYLDKDEDQTAYAFSQIARILQVIIADGKGIEVNTSSYRYGINGLTPSLGILELYRDLGGTIITLGSDSHKKEHLGAHIAETMKYLKTLGYSSYCTFDQMRPIFHTL